MPTSAMATFSSATYPDTSIISMRSRKGSAMVSKTFAVHMNKTWWSWCECYGNKDFGGDDSWGCGFVVIRIDLKNGWLLGVMVMGIDFGGGGGCAEE